MHKNCFLFDGCRQLWKSSADWSAEVMRFPTVRVCDFHLISIHWWCLSSQAQLRPWRTKAIPIRRHSCSMWELLLLVAENVTLRVLTQGVFEVNGCGCPVVTVVVRMAKLSTASRRVCILPSRTFTKILLTCVCRRARSSAGSGRRILEKIIKYYKRLQKEQVGRRIGQTVTWCVLCHFQGRTLADSKRSYPILRKRTRRLQKKRRKMRQRSKWEMKDAQKHEV